MKLHANRNLLALLVAALLALTMTSCGNSRLVRIAPKPPALNCGERTPGKPVPRIPTFEDRPDVTASGKVWDEYVDRLNREWAKFVRRWQAWGETEVELRDVTADCIDRARAAGRIAPSSH